MNFCQETNAMMIDALAQQLNNFHSSLDNRDVMSKLLSVDTQSLTQEGQDFSAINSYILEHIQPNLSGSNGGRYWGFVTGGANPVATFADWLVPVFNQNVSKGGDSIATNIERQTLTWLCQLFQLPQTFKGIFTTGATAANLLGAFTARQYAGGLQNIDVAKQGIAELDVAVLSATPHASMIKSLGLAGLGQNTWQKVNCLTDSESMDVAHLALLLKERKAKSHIVIASAATVTGTDFDDLVSIAKLCKKYNAWFHVDAAFGIFERLLTGSYGKTNGIEFADSITLDCHKWLNVPYDCGVFLTRHLSYLKAACHVEAPYLKSDGQEIDFMSLGIENSRRFRAFPVWATLKAYGKQGIRANIEKNIQQAKRLAQWIEASKQYVLVKPCQLNIVLFKPNPDFTPVTSEECMELLNESGCVLLSPGSWNAQPIIRAALSNWSTSDEDVERVINALKVVI